MNRSVVIPAVLALFLGAVAPVCVQAGPITGSEGFAFAKGLEWTPGGDPALNLVTSFTLPDLIVNGSSGYYDLDTTASISKSDISLLLLGTPTHPGSTDDFTISDPTGWGVFTGSILVLDSTTGSGGSLSRTIEINGSFAPGPNQVAGETSNTATIIFAFTQAGGAGHTISGSATLVTPGIQPFGAPEPASLTLLGFGIAGLAGYGWRRRKQQAATEVSST